MVLRNMSIVCILFIQFEPKIYNYNLPVPKFNYLYDVFLNLSLLSWLDFLFLTFSLALFSELSWFSILFFLESDFSESLIFFFESIFNIFQPFLWTLIFNHSSLRWLAQGPAFHIAGSLKLCLLAESARISAALIWILERFQMLELFRLGF